MSHDEPLISVVDENDVVIGESVKDEAHRAGLWHRLSRVMVHDTEQRILLQKRHPNDNVYPGRWDCSAAGHVDAGEDYLMAALRELGEEIGLHNVELEEIGYFQSRNSYEWRIFNRFTRVYRATVPSDTAFQVQPEEVAAVQWFTLDELTQLVEQNPDQCTAGLVEVVKQYY